MSSSLPFARRSFLSALALIALALVLSGCGRKSMAGTYQTVGSEDKFRMTLVLQDGGKAVLTTHSNLGNKQMDDAAQATMSIPDGRWTATNEAVTIKGTLGGKMTENRFLIAPTDELFWEKNGAKFVRTK